jgi:hypothetical protein
MSNLSARNLRINLSNTQLCRVVLAIVFAAASQVSTRKTVLTPR